MHGPSPHLKFWGPSPLKSLPVVKVKHFIPMTTTRVSLMFLFFFFPPLLHIFMLQCYTSSSSSCTSSYVSSLFLELDRLQIYPIVPIADFPDCQNSRC